MTENPRLRLLSYVVMAYMLLAFAWWSVLLWTKNRDAFLAKMEFQRLVAISKKEIPINGDFSGHPAYQELHHKYELQAWMILGEGIFMVLSLLCGIWLVQLSYVKEVRTAKQQRNFLLSITHELKSPLASARLILETFRKRILNDEQREKLSRSGLQEVDRLTQLVNDLLLSARLESAYKPSLEPLHLDELLEELIADLQSKYPDAAFRTHIAEGLPKVQGDKTGLSSVAQNLLENAVKYSPVDATVECGLYQEEDRYLVLEVADNGIGIPDKEKARVFDRFYRVGNEDTRSTKGTGLGLFIVKEIVKAHGGHVRISDNLPAGTIFKVYLPQSP